MALGYRTLSRKSNQRKALLRDLITDLILNGRIETTVSKAKELKRLADKMVTLGKKGDLAARRQAAEMIRFETDDKGNYALQKLFNEIETLPDELTNQVIDFIEYLKLSYVDAEAPENVTIKSKKDLKEKLQKGLDDVRENKVFSLDEAFAKIDNM